MALASSATACAPCMPRAKVHRDIKPPNVLVPPRAWCSSTSALVTGTALKRRSSVAHRGGHRRVMAPEQAAARPVGRPRTGTRSAVMLFQADLRAPFRRRADRGDGPGSRPTRPVAAQPGPGVPADLDELCRDLLRCDPAARPAGTQVLARLGVAGAVATHEVTAPRPAQPGCSWPPRRARRARRGVRGRPRRHAHRCWWAASRAWARPRWCAGSPTGCATRSPVS